MNRSCVLNSLGAFLVGVSLTLPVWAAEGEILIIRHGEKPEKGLGQLSCKGFNRSLALPALMKKRFGALDAIVVPNPGAKKADKGVLFSYVRPLATVEPLAISLEMPVETELAFNDLAGLEMRFDQVLTADKNQRVLVAWEHKVVEQAVRDFLKNHDLKVDVPHWGDDDFDSIYIIKKSAKGSIQFRVEKQELDHLPDQCEKH